MKSSDDNPRKMLFRFSLYGFLKNQRYFEPFLILFFRQMGMSFFIIGLLIGYREVLINLFEVPTGAAADLYGRRKCMILSFTAYIASFVIFASAGALWQFFVAMGLYAIGDAFRTGTHKAMIFDYLARHGRSQEKTLYYGKTRSWSKFGSALSIVIAAVIVFTTAGLQGQSDARPYRYLFLACLLPYVLGIINFIGYPSYLDGEVQKKVSLKQVFSHLASVAKDAVKSSRLRQLFVESIAFEGTYKVAKDYLQPIVKYAALSLPLLGMMGKLQKTAALILVVYVLLHLLEGMASRRSEYLRLRAGGEEAGARLLWWINLAVFIVIAAGLGSGVFLAAGDASWGIAMAIIGFVALAVVQNLWRPLQVGRYNTATGAAVGATVLSIESQLKSITAAILAPLIGLAVDALRTSHEIITVGASFVPVALFGIIISLAVIVLTKPMSEPVDVYSTDTDEAGKVIDEDL